MDDRLRRIIALVTDNEGLTRYGEAVIFYVFSQESKRFVAEEIKKEVKGELITLHNGDYAVLQ